MAACTHHTFWNDGQPLSWCVDCQRANGDWRPGEHDLAEYHSRVVCRRCTKTWCCGASVRDDRSPCVADAPVLTRAEYEELEPLRIAFVDLETSGLDADGWNTILCGAVAEYQPPTWKNGILVTPPWGTIHVFSREDYPEPLWEDRRLSSAIAKAIERYDVVVTWNGVKFDEPFLATRRREYGVSSERWPRHKDLMYTARYKLRMSSATLENVALHLNIYEKYGVQKTKLDRKTWRKAVRGHAPSYRYVLNHCREDVKVLAAVWEELKGLVTEIK